MPAPSKKAKIAKARRKKGAATFTATVREASGSEWEEEEEDGGHKVESEDKAYGAMQQRFANYFGTKLDKENINKAEKKVSKDTRLIYS